MQMTLQQASAQDDQPACLVVADLVHQLEALQRLLDGDAHVLLRQRAWPEAVVEVEQALQHTQLTVSVD